MQSQSRRTHYALTRLNNQHTTVAPGDTFILHIQVLYFPIRPGCLEHHFSPRPISSLDFFQHGQNLLCSTLSHSRFVIDSLEDVCERIVYSVREMFQVGSISDFLSLEFQNRVIPLSLSVLILDDGVHAATEESRQSFQSSRRNHWQPSRRNQRQPSRGNHMSEEAIISTFLKKCTVMVGSEDCCICLEELNINAECYTMPCQHVFHLPCILTWLKTSNVCPLCRYSLPSSGN
ncbi:E3 ubiquitin-protein ligase [Vigna unguiculata]|uniref:RING-type E3 ubiquitin transferase n=1 Tax=Vigna unguiculata TaxID=3917 RepID=A0A4D6LE79_VIGUN|nr:E3 ubiquitin-protein ligase [Vigna unguiculata]